MGKRTYPDEEISLRREKTVEITHRATGITRKVSICQVVAKSEILGYYGIGCGFSILNPEDKESGLGAQIAKGKAMKNPFQETIMLTNTPPPSYIVKAQYNWTVSYLEEHLVDLYPRAFAKVLPENKEIPVAEI